MFGRVLNMLACFHYFLFLAKLHFCKLGESIRCKTQKVMTLTLCKTYLHKLFFRFNVSYILKELFTFVIYNNCSEKKGKKERKKNAKGYVGAKILSL